MKIFIRPYLWFWLLGLGLLATLWSFSKTQTMLVQDCIGFSADSERNIHWEAELKHAQQHCPALTGIPLIMLAQNQLKQKHYAQAKELFQQALEHHEHFLKTLSTQDPNQVEEVFAFTIGTYQLHRQPADATIAPVLHGSLQPEQQELFLRLLSAQLNNCIGLCNFAQKRFAEAIPEYQRALRVLQKAQEQGWHFVTSDQLQALLRVAESYSWLHQPTRALPIYQQAAELAQTLNSDSFEHQTLKLKALREYAWTLARTQHSQQAMAITKSGQALQASLLKQYQHSQHEAYLRNLPLFPGEDGGGKSGS